MRGWVWGKIFSHTARELRMFLDALKRNSFKPVQVVHAISLSEPHFFGFHFTEKWWSEGRTICRTFFFVPLWEILPPKTILSVSPATGHGWYDCSDGKPTRCLRCREASHGSSGTVTLCFSSSSMLSSTFEATIPSVVFPIQPRRDKSLVDLRLFFWTSQAKGE